jgi:DNA-binding MarR family transcriptional regulator
MRVPRRKDYPCEVPLVIHPALKGYFGYCFVKSAVKLRALLDQALAEYGMLAPMLGLLRVLEASGPISQVELGRAVGIDKATMVKFLDQMQAEGLVTRKEGSPDRRVKLVSLSQKGLRTLAAASKVRRKVEEDFLSPLSVQERKAVLSALPKLLG